MGRRAGKRNQARTLIKPSRADERELAERMSARAQHILPLVASLRPPDSEWVRMQYMNLLPTELRWWGVTLLKAQAPRDIIKEACQFVVEALHTTPPKWSTSDVARPVGRNATLTQRLAAVPPTREPTLNERLARLSSCVEKLASPIIRSPGGYEHNVTALVGRWLATYFPENRNQLSVTNWVARLVDVSRATGAVFLPWTWGMVEEGNAIVDRIGSCTDEGSGVDEVGEELAGVVTFCTDVLWERITSEAILPLFMVQLTLLADLPESDEGQWYVHLGERWEHYTSGLAVLAYRIVHAETPWALPKLRPRLGDDALLGLEIEGGIEYWVPLIWRDELQPLPEYPRVRVRASQQHELIKDLGFASEVPDVPGQSLSRAAIYKRFWPESEASGEKLAQLLDQLKKNALNVLKALGFRASAIQRKGDLVTLTVPLQRVEKVGRYYQVLKRPPVRHKHVKGTSPPHHGIIRTEDDHEDERAADAWIKRHGHSRQFTNGELRAGDGGLSDKANKPDDPLA